MITKISFEHLFPSNLGVKQFSKLLGGTGSDIGRAVAFNSAISSVCVTGSSASASFDGVSGTAGVITAFLSCYSTSGAKIFTVRDSTSNWKGNGIATDSSGNIYITGYQGVDITQSSKLLKYSSAGSELTCFLTILS
jgi:hypothetical protein